MEALTFHFVQFDISDANRTDFQEKLAIPAAALPISDASRLRSNLRMLHKLSEQGDPQSLLWKSTILRDLFLLAEAPAHTGSSNLVPSTTDRKMADALTRMQAVAYRPLSMKHLAADLGISSVQLTRRFRAAYSLTPSDYIAELRIDRIKSLLLETNLTLHQIAELCGYDNGYYLSRIFSARVGISPSEYRRYNRV